MRSIEYMFLQESNEIEGYYYTIENYIMSEEPFIKSSISAFNYVKENCRDNLSQKHIKKLHSILFDGWGHELENKHIGKYRDCQVWVGDSKPPHYQKIAKEMGRFIRKFNNTSGSIKSRHYEFERIHPFIDGNGRIGRLLWLWDTLNLGHKVLPVLTSYKGSGFFEKRNNYYKEIYEYVFLHNLGR